MMWHDMLLNEEDRWKGYIVSDAADGLGELYKELPKDVVICDWQYYYPKMTAMNRIGQRHVSSSSGFDAGLPMAGQAGVKAWLPRQQEKLFGMLETTWHRCRGSQRMETLFLMASNAAWHPDWAPRKDVVYIGYLNQHLREVNQDMNVKKYTQFGSVQYQVDLTPYQE